MCKLNKKSGDTRIDPCIQDFIFRLKQYGIVTLGSCCGHKKYPMTIVVKDYAGIYEIISGVDIPRKKKFYKKDKQGYYYIPEVK